MPHDQLAEFERKVRGSLLTSAAGDALGAGVFKMDRERIATLHPGGLQNFSAPPEDNYLSGMEAAEVTDGTSQVLLLADVLVRHGVAAVGPKSYEALRDWLHLSEFGRFVGPSTGRALREGPPAPDDNPDGSNGAAMRIAPIGWFCPGDPERAVASAVHAAGISHTGAGVIGACMVAAAVAVSMTTVEVDEAVAAADAAIEQAARIIKAPDSGERMRTALQQAIATGARASAGRSLRDRLALFDYPTATNAHGSVAAAFGCLIAGKGDPREAVLLAVNAGDDTHTTAMMTGAMAGALSGRAGCEGAPLANFLATNRRLHGIDFDLVVRRTAGAAFGNLANNSRVPVPSDSHHPDARQGPEPSARASGVPDLQTATKIRDRSGLGISGRFGPQP